MGGRLGAWLATPTRKMKPKELEAFLQRLETFSAPKVSLEQYVTPPHIAAHVLWNIQEFYGDIDGKNVVDLGCGCGTLSLGCVCLGATSVIGVDIDGAALEIAHRNADNFDMKEEVSFVLCDVGQFTSAAPIDVVIMNPPFGTKSEVGIDSVFVEKAVSIADTVYSMHKSSTRKYWLRKSTEMGVSVEPIVQIYFDISKSFQFHKQKSKDIEVDVLRFCKKASSRQ